jgi:4a-hydroxytetrahydrobiopterin dehydratase
MTAAYTQDQCKAELANLNTDLEHPWHLEDDKLTKEFTFPNFVNAFGYMAQVAIVAEKHDHHPEWFNVYKTVKVQLTTHEAGGISQRDFDLAHRMEKLAIGQT